MQKAVSFHIYPLDDGTKDHFLKIAHELEPRVRLEETTLTHWKGKKQIRVLTFLRQCDMDRLLARENLTPALRFVIYGLTQTGSAVIMKDLMKLYSPILEAPKPKRSHHKKVTVTV